MSLMDGFFSFFGKLTLVLLVVAVLVAGGYFLGTGKLPFPVSPAPGAVTTTAPSQISETLPNTTVAPSPVIASQTVTGGGLSGTSFGAYTLTVPNTWTVKKETNSGISEKLTVSRAGYTMSIYQAATGGAQCVYPGETGGEMSTSFGAFITLHDASGNEYRRAIATGSTTGFTICQKGSGGFGLPTMYGHVSYSTPAPADPTILEELDAIFATLKKS